MADGECSLETLKSDEINKQLAVSSKSSNQKIDSHEIHQEFTNRLPVLNLLPCMFSGSIARNVGPLRKPGLRELDDQAYAGSSRNDTNKQRLGNHITHLQDENSKENVQHKHLISTPTEIRREKRGY